MTARRPGAGCGRDRAAARIGSVRDEMGIEIIFVIVVQPVNCCQSPGLALGVMSAQRQARRAKRPVG
ncbi:hypothetical protein C1I95_21880 [Micromonospora craterilacus]|uniref:Uncharacterized protein n=1 Tax=Micromonospora craterilacus TaxID=1655439 RepID=A0A2W2DQX8_9ACTN|nr:hypothetical protein C1I95_21880 [Micromonospora craterilacus]